MKDELNHLVELYKNLSTIEKMNGIVELLRTNLAVAEKLNSIIQSNREILFNKEILDFQSEQDIDDFLETIYVYIHAINDQYVSFAEKALENLEE